MSSEDNQEQVSRKDFITLLSLKHKVEVAELQAQLAEVKLNYEKLTLQVFYNHLQKTYNLIDGDELDNTGTITRKGSHE